MIWDHPSDVRVHNQDDDRRSALAAYAFAIDRGTTGRRFADFAEGVRIARSRLAVQAEALSDLGLRLMSTRTAR